MNPRRGIGHILRPRRHARRRWGAALLVAVVVAGSAGVAANTGSGTYNAAVRLLGTTIGVGGSFDGLGLSIPLFFYGTVVPQGDSFHTVPYPGQINLNYPIVSGLPVLSDIPYWPQSLKRSEAVGAGYLEQDIAGIPAGEKVTIIGMSQGTQVAEIARADMAKDPNYVANAGNYEFVMIGDPYQPNGGILSRFTSWADVPIVGDLFPLGRPGPSDSPFKTTYYQNQYDGFADFPAYFNVLAITNALMGIVFEHVFPGYVLDSPNSTNAVSTTVGNSTYVTIPKFLPLLEPLRLAAALIGARRFVDALDPILRVFVEMGYDRTADPSQVKQFGWTTPAEKLQEATDALPGAIAQSLAILRGEPYSPSVPAPEVADEQPETPVTSHPALPVDTSPVAQAVRRAVVGLTQFLTAVTTCVATVLRVITGHQQAPTGTPSADVSAEPAVPTTAAVPPSERSARLAELDTPARSPRLGHAPTAVDSGSTPPPPRRRSPIRSSDAGGAGSAASGVTGADPTVRRGGRERPDSVRPAERAGRAADHADRPARGVPGRSTHRHAA